jgi:acyl-[acyl-carrier-protein]-phospholipid O-acyltransferase/long-chain-fatty-acid--[acyl-carrier-protein] ligase
MRAVHVAANANSSAFYLTLAGAVFVVPFLLFSATPAISLTPSASAESSSASTIFEIFVMAAGLAAFFLTALHSAVFSPAKYGIVPEMLPGRDLPAPTHCLK